MFCENCGTEIPCGARACVKCGKEFDQGFSISNVISNATDNLLGVVGVNPIKQFSFKSLMSEAMKKHTREELEEHFLVGTLKTTPSLINVKGEWPKPWMFLRCLISSLVLYLIFSVALDLFVNLNLIPGLVILGTVAVPVSGAVFFFELNVWKNISLFEIGKFIIAGGVVSIIIALLLFSFYDTNFSWLSAASAGIIEEPAKLLTLVFMTRNNEHHYKLNGLVLGAAIGTGFAIFESMGYSICALITSENIELGISDLRMTTIWRGILSPFCHIVWTAIAGAALWRVCNGRPKAENFLNPKFLRVFAVSILCHMVWNYSAEQGALFLLALPIEVYVVWRFVLSLANEGIREVPYLQQCNIVNETSKGQ